jgi:hypothetical protein
MRLPAEKVKEAVLHADQDVRAQAAYHPGGYDAHTMAS